MIAESKQSTGPRFAPPMLQTPKSWAFAKDNGYVVLTHDLDFSGILASTHGKKPSVVQIRSEDVSPNNIGRQVILALLQTQAELDVGALVTIDPLRLRIRLLPLLNGPESDS